MPQMKYEHFIRRAFGLNNGGIIDRSGDPAALADTDIYRDDKIHSIKAAVAYSMEIFNKEIDSKVDGLSQSECDRIEDFPRKIILSNSIKNITDLVEDYVNSVEFKYFTAKDGVSIVK